MNILAETFQLAERPPVNMHPAWRSATDSKPVACMTGYYAGGHSDPVQAVLFHAGEYRVSTQTWRYSLNKGGWLLADLPDGYDPRAYTHLGTVTHWCPLQALCA